VLFGVRRLTLLVPDAVPTVLGQHVAVAWKPSDAADRVTQAALPLLSRAARVAILIGAEQGGDAAEPPMALAAKSRRGRGPIVLRRFQEPPRRSPGAAAEAHLAVPICWDGAYTHSRLTEMVLGAPLNTSAAADLPVLLHH